MKKTILFLAAVTLMSGWLQGQSISQAQKLMDKYNYSKAIEVLKKAVKTESKRAQAVPMLAECYKQQRDLFNSKAWYAQAVTFADAKPEVFLEYAKALQGTGDYTRARDMFKKYKLVSGDNLGDVKASHCDSVIGPWADLKPLYEAKLVNKINTPQSDFGPAFYEGNLIYASDFTNEKSNPRDYGWTGRGFLDIMKSAPAVTDDYWGDMKTPSKFDSKFNQQFHDGPACFSPDGNLMVFTRSYDDHKAKKQGQYKTHLLKMYYCEKKDGKWGDVKAFYLNSPDYSVGHPSLSADGQTLYFASDMPGGLGGTDIWKCKKLEDGFSGEENLGKVINTTENEMFPTMAEDGTLYFSSEGHAGYGALDVFKSRETKGNWSEPENMHLPINSSFDDFAIAFAPGQKGGFFSSNRPGGPGNDDIYAFRPIPGAIAAAKAAKKPAAPKIEPTCISGYVKDKVSLQPIENATVFVLNPTTGKVTVVKTNGDGYYKMCIDGPAELVVKGMKPTYIADCSPFPVTEMKPGVTLTAPRDLMLDKLELNRVFRIDNIYYDLDKYYIRPDAVPELEKLITIMKENPVNVELSSHTDCRASDAYNDRLSQNRAEAAVRYIVYTGGISMARITAKGYGEHQLVNQCADGVPCTEAEHQMNRRTEFKIIEYSSPEQQIGQFNPDLFNNGEELDYRVLPGNFFNPCK